MVSIPFLCDMVALLPVKPLEVSDAVLAAPMGPHKASDIERLGRQLSLCIGLYKPNTVALLNIETLGGKQRSLNN
jgi:hypothetical protein